MEKLSFESEIFQCPDVFRFDAIGFVTYNWMSYICHMNTYLMCSSCFECYFYEAQFFSFIVKNFYDSVVRNCFASFNWIFYSHFESIIWIATNNRFDCSNMVFWFSYDESEVGFLDFMVMNKLLEFSESYIIFCYEYETAGFFIESMDYTRSIFSCFSIKIFDLCYELID